MSIQFRTVVRVGVEGEGGTSMLNEKELAAWYRAAESQFGAGYLGLPPRTKHRGNCIPRISEEALDAMREVIETEYETVKQKTKIACWAILNETASRRGFTTPSYSSLCLAVRRRSRVTQTLKRQGLVPRISTDPSIWNWI